MINPDGTWKVKAGEEFTFKGFKCSIRSTTTEPTDSVWKAVDTVRINGKDYEATREKWKEKFEKK